MSSRSESDLSGHPPSGVIHDLGYRPYTGPRLSEGPATVNELAAPFDISLPAVSRHLKVLEGAGLIARTREAQWRPCELKAEPLKQVDGWLSRYRSFWDGSFDRMDAYITQIAKGDSRGRKKQ